MSTTDANRRKGRESEKRCMILDLQQEDGIFRLRNYVIDISLYISHRSPTYWGIFVFIYVLSISLGKSLNDTTEKW